MSLRIRAGWRSDRHMDTTDIVKWLATASGIIAAFMVSLDSGRRVTGWGFVIFTGSSIAWIAASVMAGDAALGTQNAVLLGINIFGIYRYLIRKSVSLRHMRRAEFFRRVRRRGDVAGNRNGSRRRPDRTPPD